MNPFTEGTEEFAEWERQEAAIPDDVAELLAADVGPDVDRTERFEQLVRLCAANGKTRGETVAVLVPWCERVKKYASRPAEEVHRVWKRITAEAAAEAAAAEPSVDDGEAPEKKSAATILVEIAAELYEFGITDTGEPFGVPREGPAIVQMLRGGRMSLRGQLSRVYFRRVGRAAPQQALADALLVAEGFAQEAEETELHLRVARRDKENWLDLGDKTGRAVRIGAGDWSIEDRPPMLFRRTALTSPLPEPVRGGKIDELWDWLNVKEEDRPLAVAALVTALNPDIPHPVLDLSGEQGSGKTTAAKVLVGVIDPSPVAARKPPRDAESWVTAAAGSWVVGIDNLSDMPEWLSDSICRAVTGDGDVRRRLYTDGELAVFAFRRWVVITGIDLGALNGDLTDRLLSIHLDLIGDEARLEEEELWPRWSDAHPRILGAVLDLAAGVAGLIPVVSLDAKPRMADYAKILACVDEILGTKGLARYMKMQGSLATESLTADDFVSAVREQLADALTFTGTSTELLNLVTPTDEKWRPAKTWPKTSRAVTQRLRRQAPVMRKAGWTVDDDGGANKDGVARWTITRPGDAGNANPPNPPNPPDTDKAGMAGQAGHEYGPSQDCTVCREPLDAWLVDAGETVHPTCGGES